MKTLEQIWEDYRKGGSLTYEELCDILTQVKVTINELSQFKDKRYELVLNDLSLEQRKLEQYKAAKDERN